MNSIKFSAFRPNGSKIRLLDVLNEFPEGDLVWSVMGFRGVGEAPDGLRMDEFEQRTLSQPGGVVMSWADLMHFSERLEDTMDCTLVARSAQLISWPLILNWSVSIRAKSLCVYSIALNGGLGRVIQACLPALPWQQQARGLP
jgi:hypothetical protein